MRRRPLILVSLLLAAFVINLDITIVNVALPTLVRELHASNSQLQWVVDAYNLVFAALLLASGSLSDRLGRKGFLLAGLGVFGVASIAGALTSTAGELIVARCFMGLGAAMIFPATLSLISNVFTERAERARAIGLWGATAGIAIALGPIVGGWLLEQFSWTSIFFAMAPVAFVGAALVAWSVPTSRDPDATKTDGPGLVLSSAAMALLTYTIIEAPNHGWSSGRSLAGFALAAGLFAAFIVRERTTAEPMLDLSLFRNPRFAAASGSVTVVFFALSGFSFLITQYFQFFKGYGPLSTGVRLLPVAISVGVMSVVGTKLAVRFGTKQVVTAGLFCSAAFFAWVSTAKRRNQLPRDSRPDGARRQQRGTRQRTRDRSDHGGRTEGQGRHRLRCQRRHPPTRKRPRRRRDRQRLRLSLQHPTDRQASRGAGSATRAHRPRLRRRRARARQPHQPSRPPRPRERHPRRSVQRFLPRLQRRLPCRRRRRRGGRDRQPAAAPGPSRGRADPRP